MASWGSGCHAALLLGKPGVHADDTRLLHTCRPCMERLTDILTRRTGILSHRPIAVNKVRHMYKTFVGGSRVATADLTASNKKYGSGKP